MVIIENLFASFNGSGAGNAISPEELLLLPPVGKLVVTVTVGGLSVMSQVQVNWLAVLEMKKDPSAAFTSKAMSEGRFPLLVSGAAIPVWAYLFINN